MAQKFVTNNKKAVTLCIFTVIALACFYLYAEYSVAKLAPIETKRPVVLELYTSQGCYSCPPADKLLGQLAQRHPDTLLPLSFHVDYWNYIGWADPFSSPKNSNRQRKYRYTTNKPNYTPQLFVEGIEETVGHFKLKVFKLINNAANELPYIPIKLKKNNNTISIEIAPSTYSNAEILLVGYDNKHETFIERGENKNKRLINYNVVTEWSIIGEYNGKKHNQIVSTPSTDNTAIIIQEQGQRKILSAARISNH